jgi:hypothetical protein
MPASINKALEGVDLTSPHAWSRATAALNKSGYVVTWRRDAQPKRGMWFVTVECSIFNPQNRRRTTASSTQSDIDRMAAEVHACDHAVMVAILHVRIIELDTITKRLMNNKSDAEA